MTNEKEERNALIYARFKEIGNYPGVYASIGREFGLGRERTKQIIIKMQEKEGGQVEKQPDFDDFLNGFKCSSTLADTVRAEAARRELKPATFLRIITAEWVATNIKQQ